MLYLTGHCQRFAPLFIKTAAKYSDIGLTFAAVDCVKHRDICTEHRVKSYPTVGCLGFDDAVQNDFVKKDVHTIQEVESFVKNFQANILSSSSRPYLRGHSNAAASPSHANANDGSVSDRNSASVAPFVPPVVLLDSLFRPEDHPLSERDSLWVNK